MVLLPGLLIAFVCAGIQALPEFAQSWLRYDRTGIENGEFWRLVSGHLAHLGWAHLVMNIVGLLLVTWLFAPPGRPWQWLVAILSCAVLSSIGLYLFSPQLQWYVGLSGILHGLVMAGAIRWVASGDRAGVWMLGLLAAKLLWEQAVGALPLSAELAGGPVAVDAHLWGAFGGLVWAGAFWFWSRRKRRL